MGDQHVDRIDSLDWPSIDASLDAHGFAQLGPVLTGEECAALAALYRDEGRFRSRIDMARFRFGAGEYKYFADPLPGVVQSLRSALYARLAPTANRWAAALGQRGRRPDCPSMPAGCGINHAVCRTMDVPSGG